jgi:hypothetical protein
MFQAYIKPIFKGHAYKLSHEYSVCLLARIDR